MPTSPLQTFIIYARADEAHKNELLRHLKGTLIASGDLCVWQDGNLLPGEDWEKSIKQNLKQSDLVLVLVSSDSLSSDFINTEELRMALEQRAAGHTTVVPIILRSCLWMSHPILRGLQGLPKNMKPVKSYADADEAWMEVLEGLERIISEMLKKTMNTPFHSEIKNEQNAGSQFDATISGVPEHISDQIIAGLKQVDSNLKAEKAKQNVAEEAAWKMATRLDVEAAYRHYLEDFPKGKYATEAKRCIAALTTKVITPQLEIPAPQPLIRDCPDCPEMVFVKGGTFMMGSEDGEDSEKPVHQVTLSDFYIGKYPVTFEEYDRFCEITKRKKTDDIAWGRGKRPVINVSWDNANAYCDWLSEKTDKNYRLPTEAEWEFAARGGVKSKGRKFSGRNDWEVLDVGWFIKNFINYSYTHLVNEKAANELGLHDMSGNVWEWCSDWYGIYPNKIQVNPQGAATGTERVIRGGSNIDEARCCRVAYRNSAMLTKKFSNVGFRLTRSF